MYIIEVFKKIAVRSKKCYTDYGDRMKKKYYLILLMLICLFAFVGCNKNNENTENKTTNKLREGKDYYIMGEYTGKNFDVTKRGYYFDTLNQPDAPYFYIICMGEKNTGGYSFLTTKLTRSGPRDV